MGWASSLDLGVVVWCVEPAILAKCILNYKLRNSSFLLFWLVSEL